MNEHQSESPPVFKKSMWVDSGQSPARFRLNERSLQEQVKLRLMGLDQTSISMVTPVIDGRKRRPALANAAKVDEPKPAIPLPSSPNANDFNSLLTEYGRAIIKSAIDHAPDESLSLKENIISAKEKIIVKYKTVENELKIAEAEIRKLRTSVANITESKALLDKQLSAEKKVVGELKAERQVLLDLRVESSIAREKETAKRKALEGELAEVRQDKKRKRESAASIWEEAEQTKLD